ncbi:MAG: tetratricopeptide repeat protein [Myxococcales bacterium]|jgi:tetratricopeptide (TPR) repeat protein
MKRTIVLAAMAGLALTGCEREVKEVRTSQIARTPAVVVLPALEVGPAPVPDKASARAASTEPQQPMPEPLALAHDCAGPVDHLARARTLRDAGDLKSALLEARRALQHEQSIEALEEAALLARRVRDRELAMRLYTALGDKVPAEALPLIKLARLAAEAKDWEKVLAASAEAILRDPAVAESYHLRGRAHLNLKRLSSAIRDFRKAAALDPTHGWAFNNLGYAYLLSNEPERAIEPLEEAARLLPQVARVHNNLGLAYEKSGDKASAREAFAKALDLDPDYVKAMVNKARLTQLASAGALIIDFVPERDAIAADDGSPGEQHDDTHVAMEAVWPEQVSIVSETMDELTEALTQMLERAESAASASASTDSVGIRTEPPALEALKSLLEETTPEDDFEELRLEAGGHPLGSELVEGGGI